MGIAARLCPFTPSFVHRFLISGPNLRIDARISRFTPSFVHRFLISGSNLRIDAAPSLLHRRMARLSPPYQRSASESNLFCGKVEWFRLLQSSRQRRMVPPAATTFCVRIYSSLPQSGMVPPAAVVATTKNSPPAAKFWGAGGDRMPRRRHNPK